MACGCRKKNSQGAAPVALTEAQKKAIREATINRANKSVNKAKAAAKLQQDKLKQNITAVEKKKAICDICSLAIFNSEGDNKFKLCSKCNRPIFIICADPAFKCPIDKF